MTALVAAAAPGRSAWRRPVLLLAAAATAIVALFARDAGDLVHLWWTSTTFGHCLFIGPVVAWLVWQRRPELARLTPAGWAPGLLAVAAGGLAWLLGDAGGVALARHVGLLAMLDGAVLTILGPNVARGLLFPMVYAVFLVPFGDQIEPPLQAVTVALTMPLLHLAGVPAAVDGVLITTPGGVFEVAEACSGAKFVLAMLAFGTLVAHVGFARWRRRAAFMAAALVVPVLANGVRAFATIYAAQVAGVAAATGFDHIVYGWLFFAIVMAAVLALGWRWFDRAPDAPAFDPEKLQGGVRYGLQPLVAATLAIAVAAAFPAWSAAVAGRATPLPARIALPEVAGWRRAPLSVAAPWTPYYPAADHFLFGRYARGGDAVDLSLAVFGQQREGHELVAFGTGVLREEDRWVRVADEPPIAGGTIMRIRAPGGVERLVATWYRVGDVVTADEPRVKGETARVRLLGGPQRAVAIHLSAEVRAGHDARAEIGRLLAALPPLDRLADRAAGL
jgi:exosortase A